MIKWTWRFRNDGNSLWSKFIRAMYGSDGKLRKHVNRSHPSIWLDIVNEVHNLKNKNLDILSLIKKKIGNGSDTSFWEETWRGDHSFSTSFPRIFALEDDKSITVARKMAHDDLTFSLRRNREDGGTSVKTRWVKEVPIKINIMAWKVRFDYLPSRFNLSKRGLDILDICCPTCTHEAETTNHIFFSCTMVREIYLKIAHWWDVRYSNFSSYKDWFHRPHVNGRKHLPKDDGRVKSSNTNAYMNDNVSKNVNGITDGGNSYMNVVKGQMQPRSGDSQVVPAVVLEEVYYLVFF
ncbi:RNA-directed DNA polymerase, eukaryota, reverse transcriptase zinc-binding domain protein [Tanacetum coccineum]